MSAPDEQRDVTAMLKEARLAYTASPLVGQRRVYEFERPGRADQRGVLVDDGRHGITVGVRLDLMPGDSLRNADPKSIDALALLGALTRSLYSRGLHSQLLTGTKGVEGILVSKHICAGENGFDIGEEIASISDAIEAISLSLQAKGTERLRQILHRTATLHVGVLSDIKTPSGLVVPTFDEAQRDRMMKTSA